MDFIGTGHYIFAGLFALAFIIYLVYAYRKDLARVGNHYRKVWLVILLAIGIYFTIFFLNKII
jgi:uncharacterized membrane protein